MGETIPFLLKKGRVAKAKEEAKHYYRKEDVEMALKNMLTEYSETDSINSSQLVRKTLLMCSFLHILSRAVGWSYISKEKSVRA